MKLSRKTKFFTLMAVLSVTTFGLFQNATLPAPDMVVELSPEQTANCRLPGSTVLGRYQKEIFQDSSIVVERDIQYGRALNVANSLETLKLDIYNSSSDNIKNETRALIVWVHGGAFIGGSKEDWKHNLRGLARRGFIVASINYRLGVTPEDGKPKSWRAEEDLKRALHYLYNNASKYNINQNKIFIAGSSAGAITVLTVALKGEAGIKIAGAVGVSGGLLDTSIIDYNDTVPLLMFHHIADDAVPIGTDPSDLSYGGSREIFRKLSDLRIKATLYESSAVSKPEYPLSAHVAYALTPNVIGGTLSGTHEKESKFFYPLICGQ